MTLQQKVSFGRWTVHQSIRQVDRTIFGQVLVHQVLVVTDRKFVVFFGVTQNLGKKDVFIKHTLNQEIHSKRVDNFAYIMLQMDTTWTLPAKHLQWSCLLRGRL